MNHYLVLDTHVTELEYAHPDLFCSDMDEDVVLSSSEEGKKGKEEEERVEPLDDHQDTSIIQIHLIYHPIYLVPCCFVRYLSEAVLLARAQTNPSLQASLQASTFVSLSLLYICIQSYPFFAMYVSP